MLIIHGFILLLLPFSIHTYVTWVRGGGEMSSSEVEPPHLYSLIHTNEIEIRVLEEQLGHT